MLPLRDARFGGLKNIFYDTAASPLLYDAGVCRARRPNWEWNACCSVSDFR